jgi:tetratricopeptide (TPR) repeat protein
MDHRGVPFDVLTTVRDKANVYSSAKRYEYNGKTGVQLPNNVFQQREYVGHTLVRTELQLSDAEWATAKPLKAAVGDRVIWEDSGHTKSPYVIIQDTGTKNGTAHDGDRNIGAVVSVVKGEYVTRPAKTPKAFGHEINYAYWDWGDEVVLQDVERVTTMTTKDACEEIVKPATAATKVAYVDFLQLNAKANKFVSHAWKYTFQDIVAALETTNQDGDILWFDICTVNQHKSETRDFDWWQTTFQDAVREIGCTVLVLSPWERPIPLTRSWCIWEVFSTLVTGANLEVVMSDTARFLDVLQNDFKRIMKELCQLDAEHAEAGQKRDEKQIKATILQNGGFAEVNSRCQMGIQGALVAIARNAVTEDSFKLMNGLGQLLAGQAKYEEALTWYDKALAGFEENGKEVSTATTYHNMASIYDEQGEYIKALAFYDKSLAILLKTLGSEHPTIATTHNNIAMVYVNQGEYTKALAFYDKTLAMELKTLGPDHPTTATTYNNMAAVYNYQGEYNKALAFYDKSLAILLKTLGPDHPSTATAYGNMAPVYNNQGEYTKALAFYDKSLAIRLKTLGPEHPATATTYHNMAGVYDKRGEYIKALAFYDKSLVIYLKTIGHDHPTTATTYGSMALVYVNQGEYTKALAFYDKTLAIRLNTLGPDHQATAGTYFNLGALCCNMGEYTQSLKHLELALAIYVKSLEPEHATISNVKSGIEHVKGKM